MNLCFSDQNIFKSSTSQIVEDLNKYKILLITYRGNYYRQCPQNEYYLKLITNQADKIDMELLRVYDYLQQKQEEEITNIIKGFVSAFKESNQLFRQAMKPNKTLIPPKNVNTSICSNCKISMEKARIQRVMQNVGLTSGQTTQETNEQMNNQPSAAKKLINIKEFLKNDDYDERHNSHIYNLEMHIMSLVSVIQQEYESKTSAVLGKETEIYRKNELELKNQGSVTKQNEKQLIETENYYQKFNENFVKLIKIPIQQTVMKMYKNIERKKYKEYRRHLVEAQTQTLISPENASATFLQTKLQELQNELRKLKSSKMESDRNILKYFETENELRKQLNTALQEKGFLEERFKQAQQSISTIQGKLQVQISAKCKQIARLQRQIIELKKNQMEKQKEKPLKVQLIPSKKSIISVEKRSSKRDSKKVFNHRPSLDFSIDGGDQSTQNYTYTRFYQGKKHEKFVNALRTSRINDNLSKDLKLKPLDFKDTAIQHQPTQIIEKQRQYNLQITNQVCIKIEGQKQQPPKQEISINSATKKVKSLRLLKPVKKQNNLNNLTKNSNNVSIKNDTTKNKFSNDLPLNTVNQSQSDTENEDFLQSKANQSGNFLSNTFQDFQTQRCKTQAPETIEEQKEILTNRKFQKQKKKIRPPRESIFGYGRGSVRSAGINFRQFKMRSQNDNSLLPDVKNQFVTLFGGQKYALDFEKNAGIWPHLVTVDKLVVDCQNSNFASQIQSYFHYLQQSNDPKLKQYLAFLTQPSTFFQTKKKSQNGVLELPPVDIAENRVKNLFTKLIRFHKLIHRNCNHVFQFLESIGFFSS